MDNESGITPTEPDHTQDLKHRPSLPSWNTLPSVNASPPPLSPSLPSSSPSFSVSSPYSPHSKTRWQLTQSEPSLAAYMSNEDDLFSTPNRSGFFGDRRNSLHVDIPARAIGHTEGVRDEDPLLIPTLSEFTSSSLEEERNTGYQTIKSVPISEPDDEARRLRYKSSSENILHFTPRQGLLKQGVDQQKSLHAPSYIACHPGSKSCPHQVDCRYIRPVAEQQEPFAIPQDGNLGRQPFAPSEMPSTPRTKATQQNATDSHSSFGSAQASLILTDRKSPEAISWISVELPLHHPRPQNPQNALDALRLTPVQLAPRGRGHRAADSSESNKSMLSQELVSPNKLLSRGSKQGGSRRSSLSGKYTVPTIPPFKASKGNSPVSQSLSPNGDEEFLPVAGNKGKAQPGMSPEPSSSPPIIVQTRPSRTLEDLLGISSATLDKRPAKTLLDPMFPSRDTAAQVAPRLDLSQPSGALLLSTEYSNRHLDVQSGEVKSSRTARILSEKTLLEPGVKRRSLFGQATAALVQNTTASSVLNPPKLAVSNEGFSNANSVFSLPLHTLPPLSNHHKTLSKSSSSSTASQMAPSFSLGQRSASPANSIATTHLSPQPNVLGSLMTPPGHAFTDPSRPLFSGYGLSPTSDCGSSSSGGSGGLNNWAKKQRDKDLRQAQRLEKALEEKIARLTRQLEWKPPVKREIGYGYGDGGEVPVEVTLLSGEKMKVLSEEERMDMEAEVKNAESSLNRVRVEIVQYGGVAGGSGSSVFGSEEYRSPSDEHAKPLVSTPSVASPATLHSPSSNATLTENVEGSNLVSRPSQSLLFTAFTSDHALFARRGESDEGPSLLTSGTSLVEPTVVARDVKPEDFPKKRDAPSQPPVPLTSSLTSSSDLSARNPALEIPPLDVDAGSRVSNSSSVETSSQKATTTTDTTSSDGPSNLSQASGFEPSSPHQKVQSSPKEAIDENREQRDRDSSLWSRWGSVFSGNSSSKERNTPTPSATAAKSTMSSFDKLSAFMFPSGGRQPQKSLNDTPSPITATPVQSVVSDPKDFAKQKRRISMSTAQPGEETSTQTMPSLNFDDSDDDDGEADDSREYVSAEEGFDDDNEDAISTAEQPHEVTTSDPKTAPIFVGASTSAQPIPGHMVQRKRSSTTTGISPPHEINARPSLLDGWHFDFSSRQPSRDIPSGLPVSTMFGHSDNHRMPFGGHTRQTSRDSDTLTFRDGRRTATPNNTFSPPSVSGQPAPVSLQIRSFGEGSIVTNNQRPPGSTAIQPSNANFSEIVTRSAKVLDDQANIIEYANARVMSGGVKIGDVLPRGTNGMIAEEDDDHGVTFEAVSPTRGQSLGPIPSGTAETAAHPASSYASRSSVMTSTASTGLYTMGNIPLNNPTMSASASLGNVSAGQVASPMTTSLTQPSLTPVSPKAISQPPPLTTPVSLSTPETVQKLSHTVQLTGINPGIRAPTSTVSSSPVTSQSSQFPGTPVEYCGDFRTTGYCRFGARCRYSHDIKPRVKSHTGTNKIYRPAPSLLSSPQRRDPLPLVPVGYNLSNVLPQPHHIPGVPLTQQLPSPFVFTPASSMAHPMTSPAATAAAQQGYLMTNPDQVSKILTSHALAPQQVLPHQPAPVVQADGEIMYDLTKGRLTETRELFSPTPSRSTGKSTAPTTTASELERGKREAREMLAARFGTSVEAVISGNPEISTVDTEGEDDIWTVSTERQHPEKDVSNDSKSGDQYRNNVASTQYGPDKYTRVYTSPHPPPSYSPVQHLQYARPHPHPHTGAFMAPHYPQAAQPSTVSTSAFGGPIPALPTPTVPLTQEEVIKMFASFGTNMIPPGSRVSHVSPSGAGYPVYTNPAAQAPNTAHVNPQGYPQHQRQSSAPYDYMYQPMPH
ncbi:hypothetical protein CPB86DRAFT_819158 [Serendipita vermifera]|nr:hypothetical protein CPB86DRAFT_819158 [Serendipita vermifera]